jgi:hypothetical protein
MRCRASHPTPPGPPVPMPGRLAARAPIPHPRSAPFAHKAVLRFRWVLRVPPGGIYFAVRFPGSFRPAGARSKFLAVSLGRAR